MTSWRRGFLLGAAICFAWLACYTASLVPESDHPLTLLAFVPLFALAFIYCWAEGLK